MNCEFASIEGFGEELRTRFADLPFTGTVLRDRIGDVVAELEAPTRFIDEDKALMLLLARDLRKIGEVLARHPMRDPHESLPKYRGHCEELLRSLGLSFSSPRLFIVDSFPEPYHTMDWIATSPDLADQQNYGIEPGNYFKRSHLAPYRSDILLAHEMMHHVIGEVDPHCLGRGLEEGIAVVFGELYVGARVVGPEIAQIYARHQWFDRRASQGNRLYAEYARMAALIYAKHGLDGLLDLIRGGRRKIKQVEQSCLDGDFSFDLPSGHWDDEYSNRIHKFTLTTIGDLAVSPLARYLADFVAVGATVEEIATAAKVTADDTAAALKELQHEAVLIMMDDDRVDYSDIGLVTSSHSLRYHV